MSMKTQIETLERKNAKQARTIERQKKGIEDRQKIIDASSDWEKRWSDVRSELSDVTRSKNDLVEKKASLERTVSGQAKEISNHEDLLRDIQRDMKTVCEAAYGSHFDPTWRGDDPETLWHDGGEYRRVMQSTDQPVTSTNEYLEPIQRLVRMIWRRTHWGLNPLVLRDYTYGESPR